MPRRTLPIVRIRAPHIGAGPFGPAGSALAVKVAGIAVAVALAGLGTPQATAQARPAAQAPSGANSSAGAGGAQAISMQMALTLGGRCDIGRWTQLDVRLTNTGPAVATTLVVRSAGRAIIKTAVELPRNADKRVPIAVPCHRSMKDVILYPGDRTTGTPLAEQDVSDFVLDGSALIAVLGPGDYLAERTSGIARGTFARDEVVLLAPESLPENSLALASVDHFIVASDLSRLRPAQQRALYEWVALGGQLTVPGGQPAVAALQGLPDALRPAEPGEIVDAAIGPALRDVLLDEDVDAAPTDDIGVTPFVRLRPAPGAVTDGDLDGAPLVVRRAVGEGAVVALAFDPNQPTSTGWLRYEAVWAAAQTPRTHTAWVESAGGLPDLGLAAAAIQGLPAFRRPPISLMAVLILGYVLAIGPLNYRYLKQRRRLDRAWLTIPVLALVASAAMYGVGYAYFGNRVRWYVVSVVRAVPEAEVAHVRGYASIFSPTARDYALDLGEALAVDQGVMGALGGVGIMGGGSPFMMGTSDFTVVHGASTRAEGLGVHQWAHDGLGFEAVIPWPKGEAVGLAMTGNTARGELPRPQDGELANAKLTVGNQEQLVHWMGDTAPVRIESIRLAGVPPNAYGTRYPPYPGMWNSPGTGLGARNMSPSATRRLLAGQLHAGVVASRAAIDQHVAMIDQRRGGSGGDNAMSADWHGMGRQAFARSGLLTFESGRAPVRVRLDGVARQALVATLVTQRVALTGAVFERDATSDGATDPPIDDPSSDPASAYPPPPVIRVRP